MERSASAGFLDMRLSFAGRRKERSAPASFFEFAGRTFVVCRKVDETTCTIMVPWQAET